MKKRDLFVRAKSIHGVELRGHGFSVQLLEKVVASPINTLDVSDLSLPDRKLCSLLKVFLKSKILSLNLRGNNVGELSSKFLSSVFLTNLTLQKLVLNSSDISLENFETLCIALKYNTTLTHFCLMSSTVSSPFAAVLERELQSNFALLKTAEPGYEMYCSDMLGVAFRNYMHAYFFLREKVVTDRSSYYILPFNNLTASRLLSGGSTAIGAILQNMRGFTFCPANLVRDIEIKAMNNLRPFGGLARVLLNDGNSNELFNIRRIDLS